MPRCMFATVALALAAAPSHAHPPTRVADAGGPALAIDWCNGRSLPTKPEWATALREARDFSRDTLTALAIVGCGKGLAADTRADVLKRYAALQRWSRLPPAELQTYLGELVQPAPNAIARTCAALDLTRPGSLALARLLGCASVDQLALDDDGKNPLVALTAIDYCVQSDADGVARVADERHALCGAAWRAFDKPALASQLDKLPSPAVRTAVRLVQRRLEASFAATEAHLAPTLTNDPMLQAFYYDVPDKAYREARELQRDGASELAAVRAFEVKASASSRPQVQGCFAELRPHLIGLVRRAKPTTVAQLEAYLGSLVARQVADALYVCAVLDGQNEIAAILRKLPSGRETRGWRLLVFWALRDALDKMPGTKPILVHDFDKLKPPVLYRLGSTQGGYAVDREGRIKKVTPVSGGVRITFETVVTREQVADCRDTNKIERIGRDGTVHYEEVCGKERTQTERTTQPPAFVRTEHADGLAAGGTVKLYCEAVDDHPTRPCAPYVVLKGKTLVGVLGVAL